MSAAAQSLDHTGIVTRDLNAAAAQLEAVGFTVTPLARHAGGRTGNRCVMLQAGYLELVATVDGGASATLDRFLARYAGVHILALGMADEVAVADRLRRAGITAPAVTWTERAVDDTDPAAPRARFGLITPSDPPEEVVDQGGVDQGVVHHGQVHHGQVYQGQVYQGRVHLIRHMTPEALWQDRFLSHANHATALTEAVLVVEEPARTAAWFARLAGQPLVPDPVDGYALPLPRGRLRIVPRRASDALLGVPEPPTLPWIAGLTLTTADTMAALRRLLAERSVPHQIRGEVVLVAVCGVNLRFQPVGR